MQRSNIEARKIKESFSNYKPKLNYIIRAITPTDEPFLYEILYHAVYVPKNGNPPPPNIVETPELARYVKNWGCKNDFGLMAVNAADQKPIAAVWIRLMPKENRGYGFAGDGIPELCMAVLPGYRNMGIGTLLLTYLLQEVDNKYKSISLSVTNGNPAIRIYERAGFKIKSDFGSSCIMIRNKKN